MAKILLLNGPNLNLLGDREPALYGPRSLAEVEDGLRVIGERLGLELEAFQSNSEGALIDRVQQAGAERCAFMLVNPGGYTHTSIGLRDAILGVSVPFVEVHITNVHAREHFRRQSFFSDIAVGTVSGLGTQGYELALRAAAAYLAAAAAAASG